MKKICVFCSSSDVIENSYFDAAHSLGTLLGRNKNTLIYGGTIVGLMGVVARAVINNGGNVIGIIPEKIQDKGVAFEKAQLIVTKDMRSRKAEMDKISDAFVTLPGGFGTLEELSEILTLKQLQYHNKPIVILNTNNFYNPLLDLFEHFYQNRFAKSTYRDLYFVTENINEALSYIDKYKPKQIADKWAPSM